MKGYANIVVKGKNGEVKREFTEGNVVFDLPRILLQKCLDNVEFGSDLSNYGINARISGQPFQAVVFYDKQISTTNPADIKVPIIYGGVNARSTSTNQRYAQRNSVVYGENDSSITQNWIWSITEDMTLRSMALKKSIDYVIEATSSVSMVKLGNKYITTYSGFRSSEYSRIFAECSLSTASVTSPRRKVVLDKVVPIGSGMSAVLCHDNEYVWLEGTSSAPVFNVYDAISGNVKRSFPASQFENLSASLSNLSLWTLIISTTEKDYVLYQNKLYVLPRIATAETIPLKYTATLTPGQNFAGRYAQVVNNIVFISDASGIISGAYEINSDDTITEYSHQVQNSSSLSPTFLDKYVAINKEFVVLGTDMDYSTSEDSIHNLINYADQANGWLHHTALNFSSPLELTAGDTLSVTYTVSAV